MLGGWPCVVTRAALMAGSPESDIGALRKEKEKITVHPFVKGYKTLFIQ